MGADKLTVPLLETDSSSSSTATASKQRISRFSSARKTAATPVGVGANAAAWRRMTAVSHTASTAKDYNEYQGMMWGNAMVAHCGF